MLVNTITDTFKGHTKHDMEMANTARHLQGMLGNPPTSDFEGMVREKLIANCPVDVTDV